MALDTHKDDLQIREVATEHDLRAVFPLQKELRTHLDESQFSALFRRQQAEGYQLAAGFLDKRPVVAAGYRISCTLSRGPHPFVDDLTTAAAEQGKGYGAAMVAWLRRKARELGLKRIYLDSRDTATGFYERVGFTLLTSKPCWIESDVSGL
jgi:GNAT superfamily N-acetyltransferase